MRATRVHADAHIHIYAVQIANKLNSKTRSNFLTKSLHNLIEKFYAQALNVHASNHEKRLLKKHGNTWHLLVDARANRRPDTSKQANATAYVWILQMSTTVYCGDNVKST